MCRVRPLLLLPARPAGIRLSGWRGCLLSKYESVWAIDRGSMAGSSAQPHSTWFTRRHHSILARPRRSIGETERRWHHGASLQRERPFDRILDLLHTGEHWEFSWATSRRLGTLPDARRECLSAGCAQCISDVHRGVALFQGTQTNWGQADSLSEP